ncbi:MAG: hypothetical protein ACT4QB_13765 [Gammaproteobacteria bacterium]
MDDLLDLLFQEPLGAVVVCNIVDCLDEALVDAPFVRAFIGAAEAAFDQEKPKTTMNVVGMLAKVARGELPVSVSGAPSIARSFLCGCTVAAAPVYDTCSCVFDVGTFKQYLVSDARVNEGHGFFLSNPDPADPELKRAIDSLNGRDDIFKHKAQLGGGEFPLFWVCPADTLSIRIAKHLTGDGARDTLGLIHHGTGVALIEIRFPANKLVSVKWARPTYADAGTHSRFRTVNDDKTNPSISGWGFTVDLGRFVAGDLVLDGLPERVVEPLAFDRDLEAEFSFVAGTTTTRGLTAAKDDDEAFAQRVLRKRTVADLRNRLTVL